MSDSQVLVMVEDVPLAVHPDANGVWQVDEFPRRPLQQVRLTSLIGPPRLVHFVFGKGDSAISLSVHLAPGVTESRGLRLPS